MSILGYFRFSPIEIIYRYLDGDEFKKISLSEINNLSNPDTIYSLQFHSCEFSEIVSKLKFELFPNVEVINFENVNFGNLGNYTFFEKLKNIKKLSFINSDIKYLNNFIETNNIDLEYLKLDNCNNLDLININRLNKLTELHIINNIKLTCITELDKCTKLKILNLRNNSIINIYGLDKLTDLESLDLGQNNISDISTIKNLNKIKYLYVDNNKIKELWTQPLLNLKYFIATSNQLEKVKILESSPDLEVIEIKNNNIKHLPNLSKMTNINYNRLEVDWMNIIDIEGLKAFSLLKCIIINLKK
jgi:Leucine-rich repeat (LRR) protein